VAEDLGAKVVDDPSPMTAEIRRSNICSPASTIARPAVKVARPITKSARCRWIPTSMISRKISGDTEEITASKTTTIKKKTSAGR
jgi:hypothetical protein